MLTSASAALSAFTPAFRPPAGPELRDLLAAEALYGAGLRRGARVLLADRGETSLAGHLDAVVGPTGLVVCADDSRGPQTAGRDPRRSFDIVFDRAIPAHDAQLAGRLRALAQHLRPGGVLMLQPPAAAAPDDDLFETGFDRLESSENAPDGLRAAVSEAADRLTALRISRAMRCAGLASIRWRAADSFGRHVRRLLHEAGDAVAELPVTVWGQR